MAVLSLDACFLNLSRDLAFLSMFFVIGEGDVTAGVFSCSASSARFTKLSSSAAAGVGSPPPTVTMKNGSAVVGGDGEDPPPPPTGGGDEDPDPEYYGNRYREVPFSFCLTRSNLDIHDFVGRRPWSTLR